MRIGFLVGLWEWARLCSRNPATEGVSVVYADGDGTTGILLTAREGHEDTVKALLRKGANANSADNGAEVCCSCGSPNVARILLDKRSVVDIARPDGFRALMYCMLHIEDMRVLSICKSNKRAVQYIDCITSFRL